MAEAAIIRMRLQEFKDIAGGYLLNFPPEIRAAKPKLLRLHIVGTPADAAGFSEIDPVTGHQLEDPAVAMEILSTSADDNGAAGGHVQSVYSIGIDGDNEIVTRLEPMHATVGTTAVTTTNLYKENFHGYSAAHGTGDMDAAGDIIMRDIADNTCWTIATAKNESDGSAFKVPDNHVAMLAYGLLRRLAPAAGVYAADEGVRIRIVYIDPIDGETGMAAADRCNNWIDVESVGGYTTQAAGQFPIGQCFESGTWIHFQHSSKVDAGELYDLLLEFLIWKK
jgi:hypothetical protein